MSKNPAGEYAHMPDQPEMVEFGVSARGADDALREVGRIGFGPRGHLTLLSARPGYYDILERVLQAVNVQETLTIKVPPPAGGNPGSVFVATVRRDDPELLSVVRDYLEQQYDLHVIGGPAT